MKVSDNKLKEYVGLSASSFLQAANDVLTAQQHFFFQEIRPLVSLT